MPVWASADWCMQTRFTTNENWWIIFIFKNLIKSNDKLARKDCKEYSGQKLTGNRKDEQQGPTV